jgi:peptidoglycan/LPS O-acetylase OafA/YrhL
MDETRAPEILPLTGLRAVLAWWVVLFHFGRELVPPVVARVAAAGHIAVDVFFVLSGYVLARRYAAVDLATHDARRAFWGRRAARVYPLYVVSLSVGFAASWPRGWSDLATASGQVRAALQLFLLNAFAYRAMFAHNWAAWSLSVEVAFYALFPWILGRLQARTPRELVVVVALACVATFVAPALYTSLDPDHLGRPLLLGDERYWSAYLKFFPVQRMPELVAGAAAALLVRARAGVSERGLGAPRRMAMGSAVGLVAIAASGAVPFAYLHSGVLLPLVLLLVVSLDHAGGSWLAGGAVVALGRASYATYILHVPLFLLCARFDRAVWSDAGHVAVYAVLLLAVSLAAHAWLEEPMRRAARRFRPRGGRAAP